MTRIIGLIAMAACLATTVGRAQIAQGDWRVYCSTDPKDDTTLFYSVPTIARTKENEKNPRLGKVRVWTEGLSTKKLAKTTLSQSGLQRVARKVAQGYQPPVLKLFPGGNPIDAVVMEEIADEGNVPRKSSMYMEIDCATAKFRVLSGIEYTEDGNIKHYASGPPSAWAYYPPQSVEDDLARLVCDRRLTTASAGLSLKANH
jgi:Surface-adhesin protein E